MCRLLGSIAFVAFSVLLAGCSGPVRPPDERADRSANAPAGFVNKVWSVSRSSTVATGTLYAFLSEGTLLITSPNSKPALGTWKYESGVLTMVEEGVAYRVDILALTDHEFRIRSQNPGEPVEITLTPAEARLK